MKPNITLTKAALASLLDGVLYPNPDDPGPYGPIGPVIRWALRDLPWVLLNPQPLPPRTEPNPDPWRFELNPEPWRSAVLARTVIDRAVAQYQFAETLAGAEQSQKPIEAVRSQIRGFVDDYCGTRPPKWPWPWPWPPKFDSARLRPLDLLVAGAQFQKAADLQNPLQADFSAGADQLFETGLKRLEASCPGGCM
ncbi:MAG: hypothetical protein ACREWG_07590 [Gammaproteobacteria bacterium]